MDFWPRQRLRVEALADRLTGGRRAPGLPRMVQIEVTSRCDLACRTCTRGKLPVTDDLAYDAYLEILDQLGPVDILWLSGQGEPLLHPDLPRMVCAAADRGITGTILHTNGMQLHGRVLDELAATRLGEMRLSIDGGAAEAVEYMRAGADLARILENCAAFTRISPTPVAFYTVLNRLNHGTVSGLPALAAQAGVKRIYAVETVPFRDGSTEREVYDRREYQFASLPRKTRAATLAALRREGQRHGVKVEVDLGWERRRCREPWQKLYVDAHGNVTPCCRIHHEVFVGNLRRDALAAVWLGTPMVRWRQALRRSEDHPRICVERCNLGLKDRR